MSLYEITSETINKISQTTFTEAGFYERGDLQRLLRKQIDVVLSNVLVIAEEFGD